MHGLGGLDILVNNAGKQVSVPEITDISDEQFDLTIQTNVSAMFWITRAAVPHLQPGPIWTPLQVVQGQPKEALPEFGLGTLPGPGRYAGRAGSRVRVPGFAGVQLCGGRDPQRQRRPGLAVRCQGLVL